LSKLAQAMYAAGDHEDGSILNHLSATLQFEAKVGAIQWGQISDSKRGYWGMKFDHPDWQVKSNVLNSLTEPIVTESMSADVNIFMNIAVGFITASVMPAKSSAPPASSSKAATMPRALLPDSGVRINGEGFGVADAEGVLAHQTMNRFVPRWIRGGTQLILSRGPVNQNGIWKAMMRFGRLGRQAVVLTGVHGDEAGRMARQTAEEIAETGIDMWKADQQAFGRTPGIKLLQADQLSDMELHGLLTSGQDIYAGWCHSGVCAQLVRAFDRANNIH
jgi:hypothetical protein